MKLKAVQLWIRCRQGGESPALLKTRWFCTEKAWQTRSPRRLCLSEIPYSNPGALERCFGTSPLCHQPYSPSEVPPTRAKRARSERGDTLLRGRIDSAEAEELVAGMGFNLGLDSGGGSSDGRRNRRRRRSSDDIRDSNPTVGQENVDLQFLEADDYFVPIQDVLAFEREGHTVTRDVFSPRQLQDLRPSILAGFEKHEMEALRQKVSVWFGDEAAFSLETAPQLRARLKRLAPDEVPFLQVFNMFRKAGPHREIIEKLVLCPRLAHIAAQLLGCERLRLYQDSTFCKRPGDGPTRWHSDLNMAPLDCNDFVTAWIPLAPVPSTREGGSPLVFAGRSHRDFALNHWQDPQLRGDLSGRYSRKDHSPLDAGDVTWHHGWTLHSSSGNRLQEARTALAISYMRDGTRLLHDSTGRVPDPEDKWSYGDWLEDLPTGDVVDHAAVPLVWNGGRSAVNRTRPTRQP